MKYTIPIFLILIGLLTGCATKTADPVQEKPSQALQLTEEQKSRVGLVVNKLPKVVLEDRVRANGHIDIPPMNRQVLHSLIGANITNIAVIPGDQVKKGQALLSMSHPNLIALQREFLEQKIEMTFQREELGRKTRLLSKEISSQKEMALTKRLYEKAKLGYQSLKSKLEMLGITEEEIENNGFRKTLIVKAPISGSISKVHITNGQFVSPDRPLIEILNQEHKHLEISVFSQHAAKIRKGQKIIFHIPGSTQAFEGEVHLINPDIEHNTLHIHGHFEGPAEQLKVGLFIEAEIIISASQVTAISNEEIIREGEDFFLFRQTAEGYKKTLVQTGRRNDSFTELIKIDTLSKWVVAGNYYLKGM